jgi:hypothetical protein
MKRLLSGSLSLFCWFAVFAIAPDAHAGFVSVVDAGNAMTTHSAVDNSNDSPLTHWAMIRFFDPQLGNSHAEQPVEGGAGAGSSSPERTSSAQIALLPAESSASSQTATRYFEKADPFPSPPFILGLFRPPRDLC